MEFKFKEKWTHTWHKPKDVRISMEMWVTAFKSPAIMNFIAIIKQWGMREGSLQYCSPPMQTNMSLSAILICKAKRKSWDNQSWLVGMRLNQCPVRAGLVQSCGHFSAMDFRICADGEKHDRLAAKKWSQSEMGDGLFSLTFKRGDPRDWLVKNHSQAMETEADSVSLRRDTEIGATL